MIVRFCLSATAERNGTKLIAVVLGAPTSAERFSAAKGLLDYGFSNYSVYYPKTEKLAPAPVWGGKKDAVTLDAKITPYLVKKGEENKIEEIIDVKKDLKAPLKKGDVIGKIKYNIGDTTLFEIDIKVGEDVEKAGVLDTFFAILKRTFYSK